MSLSQIWENGYFLNNFMQMEKDYRFYIAFGVTLFLSAILIPYLLGSVNSAVIISRMLYREDIREYGSGNAGMTNMLRTYGKGAAGLTLLGDLAKTALSVSIASLCMSSGLGGWIACLFCVVGHIFPVYYRFRGGKGVLCTAVGVLILHPPAFLLASVTFVILVAMTRYVSLGSIMAAMMLPLYIDRINAFTAERIYEQTGELVSFGYGGLISVLLALIVLWCHRANIGRIMRREESKLSFKKKKKDEDDQ